MPVSPPQQELEHHAGNLSPVSPKPLHFPAPSNIPILEKQMEPTFHETLPASLAEPQTHLFASDGPNLSVGLGAPSDNSVFPESDERKAGGIAMESDANFNAQGHTAGLSKGEHNAANGPNSATSLASAQADAFKQPNVVSVLSMEPSQDSPMQDVVTEPQPNGQAPVDASRSTAQAVNPSLPPISTVDFQSLLDNLAKIPASASLGEGTPMITSATATPSFNVRPESDAQAASTTSSLPPRPPPQERPNIHPNYTSTDDIRSFHPHSQGAAQNATPSLPNAANLGGAVQSTGSSQPSPITPGFPPDGIAQTAEQDEDAPWPPELEKAFDQYLDQEKRHEQERNWQKFPSGSRLFVGNLPTELVSKRDLFRLLHKYGSIVQISIKKAYGFVQFHDAETCRRSLDAEQGAILRGRKIHLEISHPQGSKEGQDNPRENRGSRRRSRSPGYGRGGGNPRNVDRYVSGSGRSSPPRDRDRHYRPGRSPSPRGYRGGKRGRSPDRYADRRRSPPGRYRSRSRSPQRRTMADDDLQLPRRAPGQVPDVQILVTDDLDRMFVSTVENAFRAAYLSVNTLPLPPHIFNSSAQLAKHFASERVLALVRMTHQSITFGTISVLVFDYGTGIGNISFNQYDNLAPSQAAGLVSGKKAASRSQQYQPPQANAPPPMQAHNGMPAWPAAPLPMPPTAQQGYAQPQMPPSYPPHTNNNNMGSRMGMQPSYAAPAPQRPPSSGGPGGPYGAMPSYGGPPVQQYGGPGGPGAYGSRGGPQGYPPPPAQGHQPQNPSQQAPAQPDMAEIMAQLTKYTR